MSKASFEAANYGGDAQVQIMAIPEDYELDTHVDKKWQGNAADMHDMSVLGRKQQLRVSNYGSSRSSPIVISLTVDRSVISISSRY